MTPAHLPIAADILLIAGTAAGVVVLLKKVLLAALAFLNGILAMMAAIIVWKSYLVTGIKIALTALVAIPVVGVIAYFIWANRKVREAS